MKRCIIVCFSFWIWSPLLMAQKVSTACTQLKDLKTGVLLVRLQEGINKYNALKEAGKLSQAEEHKKEVYLRNLEIVNAFKNHYSFSSVYFFYNTDTEKVKNGEVLPVLLDDSLNKGNIVQVKPGKAFIADLGEVYIETYKSFINGLAVQTPSGAKPEFPGYINARTIFVARRNTFELVQVLNKRLVRAYGKCQ